MKHYVNIIFQKYYRNIAQIDFGLCVRKRQGNLSLKININMGLIPIFYLLCYPRDR
ncbi:unnamed protein product [Paramecium sonneborni]|uniref:Uncharacterized protein n=1 Tax=Paramecium sonneborni TaxID=65129 RepID=A0A8S1QQ13_9CILI|nr:unnamed protein product [Paramecium sonneborni]